MIGAGIIKVNLSKIKSQSQTRSQRRSQRRSQTRRQRSNQTRSRSRSKSRSNKNISLFNAHTKLPKQSNTLNSYEKSELRILKILLEYRDIINDLIRKQYLKLDESDDPNIYVVQIQFWYPSGPLPKIIEKLINNNKQKDAYRIIFLLYNSYIDREKDNYNKLQTSRYRSSHISGKSPNTLFRNHENHATQLRSTLFECAAVAKKNSKTSGYLKSWVDQFYHINNITARGKIKKTKYIKKFNRIKKTKRANKKK